MMKNILAATALSFFALTAAHATPLQGAFYDVGGFDSCCSGLFTGTPLITSATLAETFLQGNPTADATFTSTGISYPQPISSNTITTVGGFLGTDASSLGNFSMGTTANTSFLGTILTLSGTISLLAGNNVFDVFSDDGFILYIDGIEIGRWEGLRGPSSAGGINFVSALGGHAQFDLVYFEGSMTQAALEVTLNNRVLSAVPLPAGGLLLIGALGGLAALRRRKAAAV